MLVAGDVWDEPRVVDFRHSPAQIGVGAGRRRGGPDRARARVPPLAARVPDRSRSRVLPLRVPLEIGGETANLLVPLYLVIAAGVITQALEPWAAPTPTTGDDPWPTRLRWLLAATLRPLRDPGALLRGRRQRDREPRLLPGPVRGHVRAARRGRLDARAAAADPDRGRRRSPPACALIGIYQYFARDLFLNPELFDANELHVYFRVNSIFFDPNIFGRYLALALTALGACLAWGGEPSRARACGVIAFAIGLVGLAFSYSLTSLAALLAGLGTVALLRWSWRGAAAVAGLGLVALVAW